MECDVFKIISDYYPNGFTEKITTAEKDVLDFFLNALESRYLDEKEFKFKKFIDNLLSKEKSINSKHNFRLVSNYIDDSVKNDLLKEGNINNKKTIVNKSYNNISKNKPQSIDHPDDLVIKKAFTNVLRKLTTVKKTQARTAIYLSDNYTFFITTYNVPDNMLCQIIELVYEINQEFKDFMFSESTSNRKKNTIFIEKIYPTDYNKNETIMNDTTTEFSANFYNKILFGPTGTGKSNWCDSYITANNILSNNVFRVTFFEDYSYYDFFGQYKPIVLRNTNHNFSLKTKNGEQKVSEHVVTYQFVPGIFFSALLKAIMLKQLNSTKSDDKKVDDRVVLLIDEINRGNCSSIFGDIFQLLDRSESGDSNYSITLTDDMSRFITDMIQDIGLYYSDEAAVSMKTALESILSNNKFQLPSNLIIIATMNTSDQSLFPMDSAFKRRWDMKYIYIDYNEEKLKNINIENTSIKWLYILEKINCIIYKETSSEDKQIGQWFIKPKNGEIKETDFRNKLISYLFFDVFKHFPEVLNNHSYSTLTKMKINELIELFDKKDKPNE
jgi:protein involved in ribonucleotide reduction